MTWNLLFCLQVTIYIFDKKQVYHCYLIGDKIRVMLQVFIYSRQRDVCSRGGRSTVEEGFLPINLRMTVNTVEENSS